MLSVHAPLLLGGVISLIDAADCVRWLIHYTVFFSLVPSFPSYSFLPCAGLVCLFLRRNKRAPPHDECHPKPKPRNYLPMCVSWRHNNGHIYLTTTGSRAVLATAAFPQDLPHQGDPGQEDEAEPADPSLDPSPHGQHHPVRQWLRCRCRCRCRRQYSRRVVDDGIPASKTAVFRSHIVFREERRVCGGLVRAGLCLKNASVPPPPVC